MSEQTKAEVSETGYGTLLDGMKPCDGCADEVVPDGVMFCASCELINEEIEERKYRALVSHLPERVNVGTVPHDPAPDWIVKGQFALFFVGCILSAALAGGLGFYGLRWAVAFCLRHS